MNPFRHIVNMNALENSVVARLTGAIQIQFGMRRRYGLLIVLVLLVMTSWSCQAQPASAPLVDALSPAEQLEAEVFGKLVARLSGQGGYFDTDNLISNESSYLHVIPRLNSLNLKGGAYIGVGPDQNFSYIAHLEPELAIILDIRRDNMLMHLLYKALFQLSDDRGAFLANLFGRSLENNDQVPEDIDELMDVIEALPRLPEAEREALVGAIVKKVLQFEVALDEADLENIRRFYREFINKGPGLRFTSHGRAPQSYYPTYRQLATETTVEGERVGFLSKEIYFQRLKNLHEANRIVPAVGNFAGPHALPEIGAYLKEQGLAVTAFYTSNVEFYLVNQRRIDRFADNVRQLPLHEGGVFIRSYFNRWRAGHPLSVPGYGSTQILQPVDVMLNLSNPSYADLILENILNY